MIRGTTQTLTFNLSETIDDIKALYITFNQNGKTVLEKTLNDVFVEGKHIVLPLKQEDTLAFLALKTVLIQLRIRDIDGNAYASKILKLYVDEILKDGVI